MRRWTAGTIAMGTVIGSALGCPSDRDFGITFDQFALAARQEISMPSAAASGFDLYSQGDIELCFDRKAVRFLAELGDVLAAAAGVVGTKKQAGREYLDQSIEVRLKLVQLVADHPEFDASQDKEVARWLQQTLKALSGQAYEKRQAKIFVDAIQQVGVPPVLSNSLVFDYVRAVASCADWNWKGVDDYSNTQLTARLCQDVCQPYVATLRDQVAEWRTQNPRAAAAPTRMAISRVESRHTCP